MWVKAILSKTVCCGLLPGLRLTDPAPCLLNSSNEAFALYSPSPVVLRKSTHPQKSDHPTLWSILSDFTRMSSHQSQRCQLESVVLIQVHWNSENTCWICTFASHFTDDRIVSLRELETDAFIIAMCTEGSMDYATNKSLLLPHFRDLHSSKYGRWMESCGC